MPSSDLFISEVVEGSSNNKAIEIYNGTGSSINLSGYSIQMFFNGSAAAGLTINLTGTIAPGDVFVLAQSSANATILAQADQTSAVGWFNGDDAIVLRNGTTVIDVFGQVGFDPGTEWGSALVSTQDNTLRRMSDVTDGDPMAATPSFLHPNGSGSPMTPSMAWGHIRLAADRHLCPSTV